MTNFIKSFIPNLLIIIGAMIEFVGKTINKVAFKVTGWGLDLHMKLDTEFGKEAKKQIAKLRETLEMFVGDNLTDNRSPLEAALNKNDKDSISKLAKEGPINVFRLDDKNPKREN